MNSSFIPARLEVIQKRIVEETTVTEAAEHYGKIEKFGGALAIVATGIEVVAIGSGAGLDLTKNLAYVIATGGALKLGGWAGRSAE